jgi:hypothetical protein
MRGVKRIFMPQEAAIEAAMIPDVEMIPSIPLTPLGEYFTGLNPIPMQELIKFKALQYRARHLVVQGWHGES